MAGIVFISVVDDDLSAQETLASILVTEGYEVKTFSSGLRLVRYLENNTCDLILLDIMMGDMDGIEVLEWLVEKDITIPVMIVSGVSDFPMRGNARIKGYFLKPYDLNELLKAIESLNLSNETPQRIWKESEV